MQLTQADFEKLVADVEKEFDLFLAKAESEAKPEVTLAKSEEESDKKEKESEEKEDEAKEASAEAKDKEKEEKDEEESHDYDDEDVEEMQKMYSAMGKAELDLHRKSMEKCWMQKCGEMSVMKSESSETMVASLTKSELEAKTKEVDSFKEENEKLKKNMEELVQAVNGFFTKKGPTRKAVTSIEYIKKSEIEDKKPELKSLTKSEITNILNRKAADPSLSKTDREAINKYYLKGGNLEVIKHLLTQ